MYSAAAGAALIALAPTADAQIVYTDLDPDEVVAGDLDNQADFEIDFDGDGTVDVTITQDNPSATFTRARIFPGTSKVAGFGPVTANYQYFYASALSAGYSVSSGIVTSNTNDGREDFLLASTFGGNLYGNWGDQDKDAYAGIEFVAGGGTTHYAWIRIDVAEDASTITVKDYAFQATPGTAIVTGEMGDVANEDDATGLGGALARIDAYPNPFVDQLQFKLEIAAAQDVEVGVYDVLGRQVATLHEGALAAGSQHTFTLNGSELPNGLYIIQAKGEQFAETTRVTLAR